MEAFNLKIRHNIKSVPYLETSCFAEFIVYWREGSINCGQVHTGWHPYDHASMPWQLTQWQLRPDSCHYQLFSGTNSRVVGAIIYKEQVKEKCLTLNGVAFTLGYDIKGT